MSECFPHYLSRPSTGRGRPRVCDARPGSREPDSASRIPAVRLRSLARHPLARAPVGIACAMTLLLGFPRSGVGVAPL
jgi:hypothetical protein